MIKKYLTIVLLFFHFYNYSQENKNKLMINGNLNYTLEKKRPETVDHSTYYNSNGTYNLNIGYFLTKNFAIGISGSYQKEIIRREHGNTQKSSETYSSSGVFTRYNCMVNSGKFGFYFQLNSNLYRNKWQMDIIDSGNTYSEHEKANGVNVIFTPGVIYFLNHKFSVEVSAMNIMYDHFIIRDDLNNRSLNSDFSTNFSPSSIYVGFSYYLGGKKSVTTKETQ